MAFSGSTRETKAITRFGRWSVSDIWGFNSEVAVLLVWRNAEGA
jgi:hypothetical protein